VLAPDVFIPFFASGRFQTPLREATLISAARGVRLQSFRRLCANRFGGPEKKKAFQTNPPCGGSTKATAGRAGAIGLARTRGSQRALGAGQSARGRIERTAPAGVVGGSGRPPAATIAAVSPKGRVAIAYDDGDEEAGVKLSKHRPSTPP